jgi:hypothetical protein
MNEMNLLIRLREEIPSGVTPQRAQDALLTAIRAEDGPAGRAARHRAGRRATAGAARASGPGRDGKSEWTRHRRLAIAGGLSLALAAGATSAMVALGGSHRAVSPGRTAAAGRAHGAVSPGRTAAASRAHAAVVLVAERAARAMLARPGFPPGQWVYFKEVDVSQPGSVSQVSDGWETADGTTMATVNKSGKVHKYSIVGTMRGIDAGAGLAPLSSITYQSLSSLPSEPAALVRYFENLFRSDPASQRPAKAFDSIGQLLTVYVTQPAFTAELYRAIADIPGVTVNTHGTDLGGRAAIVLSYKTPTRLFGNVIYLDPHTFWYVGSASQVKNGQHDYGLEGYSILRYALVSGPGVQP